MSRPLALLRPEPGWSASAAAARALSLDVIGHPMFNPEPLSWSVPPDSFDALLIGSAAVFRVGGEQLGRLRRLPVYAVGEATAHAARAAGFAVAETGQDRLQSLLDAAAGRPLRFLRLAGEERVEITPRERQSVTERAVYRMVPRPLERGFAAALATQSPVVALHSAAAARHFKLETDRLGIERGTLFVLALAPRVAREAGLGWAALHIADAPSEAALLAKAAALCK